MASNDLSDMKTYTLSTLLHYGCLPFSKNIRKFWLKVKWNSNFSEISFGNCRLSSEVVLFFLSERNDANFLTICWISQLPVSHQPKPITRNRTANGKRHLVWLVCYYRKKPYHYSKVIPISSFWQMVSTLRLCTLLTAGRSTSHFVGFLILLRSFVRFLQCYWFIWEKDSQVTFWLMYSFVSGPV